MQTKHDMNSPPNQASSPSSAAQSTEITPLRRRLLAGSLSAPLALTVTSAMGASRTTFSACLDNARLQPKPDRMMLNSSNSDDWLRVRVTVYEISLRDGNGRYVVEPGKYFYSQNGVTVYRLNDKNPESGPATRVTKFDGHFPGLKRRVLERRDALAYTDDQGKIVGYGWESNGGAHCKKSCFTSVVARAKGRARA